VLRYVYTQDLNWGYLKIPGSTVGDEKWGPNMGVDGTKLMKLNIKSFSMSPLLHQHSSGISSSSNISLGNNGPAKVQIKQPQRGIATLLPIFKREC